jgi:DNA-binding CsgD family transcriptional regulator
VNYSGLFRGDPALDLTRLNDAERRVLRLLAEGHAAKSIANTLETTPAAVNERLREARRKTGAGSSRELARFVKTQECRDDQIGVAVRRHSIALPSPSAAEPWRLQTGVLAMVALFLGTIGAVALVTGQPSGAGGPPTTAVTNEIDPLIGAIPSSESAPDRLHARLREEQRDEMWASRVEQAMRDLYSRIPHVGGPHNVLRVTCGATFCEVAGTIDAPFRKGHEYDSKDPLNIAMRDLQGAELRDALGRLGLKQESAMFAGSVDKPPRSTFLEYYSRAEAKPK